MSTSNRAIVVRISGIGDSGGQFEFTSRAGVSYLTNAVAGVVVDLSDQLSSEIAFLGSLGSDPTCTITMLTTDTTSAIFNGRLKQPVRNATEELVTTASYVLPEDPTSFEVSDASTITVGQLLRINTTVFEVLGVASNTVTATRVWGSARVPIPMAMLGDNPTGQVVYDATPPALCGGVEGLPVVVSTVELSATSAAEEEVIFRGLVNRCAVDTSAGGANVITIDCGSLMAYLRAAAFRPSLYTWVRVYRGAVGTNQIFGDGDPTATVLYGDGVLYLDTYGPPLEPATPFGTFYGAINVHKEGVGGTLSLQASAINASRRTVDVALHSPVWDTTPEGYDIWLQDFAIGFKEGIYGNAFSANNLGIFDNAGRLTSSSMVYEAGWATEYAAETCFAAASPLFLLVDLLLGTVNGGWGSGYGCRSATEAAWLPFNDDPAQLIDYASLVDALEGREDCFPSAWLNVNDILTWYLMPTNVGSDKTIGEVLERVLKLLGIFLVFDRGTLRFGSWTKAGQFPTVVTDAALALPVVRMSFDRTSCVQLATVKVTQWNGSDSVEIKRPIVNADLGLAGIGKQWEVGTAVVQTWGEPSILALSSFATASDAILRYSQPAAMVTLTLLDTVTDLNVGDTIALSTNFLPSASGAMGFSNASGMVLKAARKWDNPSTEYLVLVTGYLASAYSRSIALLAASGEVQLVAGNNIKLVRNAFTRVEPLAGAPTTDCDAFRQVRAVTGVNPLPVILLDQFGTQKGGVDFCTVDVPNDLLKFSAAPFGGLAVAGDVVVLPRAPAYVGVGTTCWDAYQADANGRVNGSLDNAYRWSIA